MLHDHNFRTADDSASKVLNGLQFSIDNDDDSILETFCAGTCVRKSTWQETKGAFQKLELAGRTIAGPVILTMKNVLFFQEFLLKHNLLRTYY